MKNVSIQIVEYLSSDSPGFVAAQLEDAYGKTHVFHDKVPVFTNDLIDGQTELPVPGWLGCEVVERFEENGCSLARIDTEKPWDIESTSGAYSFVVLAKSLVDNS